MGNPLFDPADSGAQYLTDVGQTGGANLIIDPGFDGTIGAVWMQATGGPWSLSNSFATTSGGGITFYKWGWNIGDEPTLDNYLSSQDKSEIYVIYTQFIMADSGVATGNYMAVDEDKLETHKTGIVNNQPQVIITDIESLALGTNDTDEEILAAWATYDTVLTGIRDVYQDGLLGVYAYMPQRNSTVPVNYRIDSGNQTNIDQYNAWKARNSLAISGGIPDRVDIVIPSLYTFYRDTGTYPDVNDDPAMDPQWGYYAEETISEARRLCPNKPILPALWPQYHQGGDAKNEPGLRKMWIEGDFFKYQLDKCAELADGFIIFDNLTPATINNVWDESWGWVQALRTYIGPAEPAPEPTDKYLWDYRPYNFTFEELEDDQVLLDYGASGNDGQLGSTTGIDSNDPDRVDGGLQFDGNNDYCIIPTGVLYDGDWSIFGIVTNGTQGHIYCEADTGDNDPHMRIFADTGKLKVAMQNEAGNTQAFLPTNSGVLDGQPHSFLITFDYSLGDLKLYVDGNLDASDDNVTGNWEGCDQFNIGRRVPSLGGNQNFDGILCVFKYIRALLGTGDAVSLHNEYKDDLEILGVDLIDI